MSNRNEFGKVRRNRVVSGIFLAAMLAVTATPSSAQDTADFEDPLAQIRAQVQQVEAGNAPTDSVALASAGNAATATATPDVNDPLARISKRLGLPVLGLVALAGLAVLALLLGMLWFVSRLRSRRGTMKPADHELYAVDDGARGRRELKSGSMATYKGEPKSKATDALKLPEPSAAAAAAAIISDDVEPDYDEYDLPETASATESAATKTAKVAEAPVDPSATDTSSWRRPNLDRLKESIREDWHAEKDEAAGTTATATAATTATAAATTASETADAADEHVSPLRREAENFASLFGDDDAATPVDEDTGSYFSEGLGSSSNSDRTMFSDLRSTIEKNADISPRETLKRHRPELPSRDDALRRIKALRQSVKAS